MISSLAFSSTTFVSFEIIGTADEISFQITCGERDREGVLSQLKSHLPQIDFRIADDYLEKCFPSDAPRNSVAVDFGLGRHSFIPLPAGKEFATDPLLPLV